MHTRWTRPALLAITCIATACSTPSASALPPGFPDMAGFTDMTTALTTSGGRGQVGITFSPPQSGFSCGFGMPPEVTPDNQEVSCTGLLPGIENIPIPYGSTTGECDLGSAKPNPAGIYHYKGRCTGNADTVHILNPGQKVSYGNITCGVTGGGITACLDTSHGEHGFVLDPAGSWAF